MHTRTHTHTTQTLAVPGNAKSQRQIQLLPPCACHVNFAWPLLQLSRQLEPWEDVTD